MAQEKLRDTESIEVDVIKQRLRDILAPIQQELFQAILWYNGTLQSCGYVASIITKLLQGQLPSAQVRIGYGYKGPEEDLKYHYWTEIDDKVFVDSTYGQYDASKNGVILVEEIGNMAAFDLTRLDRSRPHDFSRIITEGCGRQTVLDLVAKPNDPFIPGFQFVWESSKREHTLGVIKSLEEKLRTEPHLSPHKPTRKRIEGVLAQIAKIFH